MLSKPQIWFFATIVWFVTLFVLSSNSLPQPPGPEIPHLDKVVHTLYFAAGATCFFLGGRLRWPQAKVAWMVVLTVIFSAVIGASDEFHQTFTPHRSGNDPFDWLADVLGGVLGAGIGGLLHGWVKPKPLVAEKKSR